MLVRIISLLRETLVFWSSFLVKKDDNIWVFGSIRGLKYSDNAKYLFEYINLNTEIHAIWISKNQLVVNEVRAKGFEAYFEKSHKALYYAKRARIAVITHRGNRKKSDLPFYAFNSKTKVIQLWHGFPLKKVGYDDKLFSFKHDESRAKWRIKAFLKNSFFPFMNNVNSASLTVALSDETRTIFSKAFRTPMESVGITGYPRNDVVLSSADRDRDREEKIKKAIYMPTFRGSVNSDFDLFTQFGFDVNTIDAALSSEDMKLSIKLHPFNKPTGQLLEQLEGSNYITLLEHDDISEILSQFDLLITDYSSVFIDYLLLDRPIIFSPFDKDEYLRKYRNFYFDYDEITPGPKARNWSEVVDHLRVFNSDSKCFAQDRMLIKNRFHLYQDNGSSHRVYEAIESLIKGD